MPFDVIVGGLGILFTVTATGKDVAEQIPLLMVTVYIPVEDTVIDCVVSPLDHKLPVKTDEVKITVPP